MNDDQPLTSAAVIAEERDCLAFRRDYSPQGEYPFGSLEGCKTAWDKSCQAAKEAGKAYRDHLPPGKDMELTPEQQRELRKQEEDAYRTAWVQEWKQAEQAGLKKLEQILSELKQEKQTHQREIAEKTETIRRWKQEMEATEKREKVGGGDADEDLVGLAFSGGGIRSATFNLGLLQGLAELGLLKFVDYLSTVSGGGYIGGWLAAWCRHGRGLDDVARQLRAGQTASEGEPAQILHLRRHSNYLAPRQGFLSADVWVLWATYLRNFLLNQLVLLPATIALLLVVRFVMLLYYPWSQGEQPSPRSVFLMASFAAGTAVFWFVTFVLLFRAALKVMHPLAGERGGTGGRLAAPALFWLSLALLLGSVLLCTCAPYPLLLGEPRAGFDWTGGYSEEELTALFAVPCMALAGLAFVAAAVLDARKSRGLSWWKATGAFVGASAAGFLSGALLSLVYRLLWSHRERAALVSWLEWAEFAFPCAVLTGLAFLVAALLHWATRGLAWKRAARSAGAACLAGLAGGSLLFAIYRLLHGRYEWDGMLAVEYVRVRATAEVMTAGPPLVLLALALAVYAGVGLAKGQMKEGLREWWSSVCARLLAMAAVWTVVNLVALYGTPFVLWAGPWVGTALGSGWLLTVGAGVLAGKGPGTGNRPSPRSGSYREWLARLAPYAFVLGLLVGVSLLLHIVLDCPPRWRYADDRVWLRQSQPERPPSRVVLSRTKAHGAGDFHHERQDTTEHVEAIDDKFIVQQMYWVGILNTDDTFVPYLDHYYLTSADLKLLKERHHFRPETLHALQSLVDDPKEHSSQEEFETALDPLSKTVPDGFTYAERATILQHAKNVVWLAPPRGRLAAKLGLWLLGCLVVLVVAAWRVDVNLFSLHALYGNRLIRAYLGASRVGTPSGGGTHPLRTPDPVTGLDPRDDFPLSALVPRPFAPPDGERGYDGPYPIVNTALNLVHNEDLAWQERKAEAFALTPLYCGSATTGYRATERAYPANVTLGNAMTLSGAAASPNMGYHSSPAVTVLLTVFNARLGAWVGNPRDWAFWRRHGPWFGFWHLFKELFGLTDDRTGYVFLSDGGHFENLGVYELVRRRCRYIIVSDAGQDVDHRFEDVANLVRKCRVDLGIPIDIELDSLALQGPTRRCRWHCAIGKIRYDKVCPGEKPGILVYLKPSLSGAEPADVLQYAAAHPTFPHESTGNQFYTESQFESYRALGQYIARAVFEQSVADMDEDRPPRVDAAGERRRRRCRALFASLDRRWFAMPPKFEATFQQTAHGFLDIQTAFRRDERLWRLTFDLYPELEPSPDELDRRVREESDEQRAGRQHAELHTVAQMLQVMENAWLSLNLDIHYAHPLNRGWMDVFHRWTNAETVRRHWPVLRAEFARGFVSFCEKQMQLGVIRGEPVPATAARLSPPHRRRLCLEFREQWPEESPDLEERLSQAESGSGQWAWLVYPTGSPPGTDSGQADGMPCGVIHVSPLDGEQEPPIYDLFVWMRGAYRNSGLGRTAVAAILDRLPALVKRDFRLRVRLPVGSLVGPGGELQKGMWLNFFYHHEFRRVSPPENGAASRNGTPDAEEILLERACGRQTLAASMASGQAAPKNPG